MPSSTHDNDTQNSGGLLGSLEQDFAQEAQNEAAQERAALHEVLKKPLPETVPVYERNAFSTLSLFLIGTALLCVGFSLLSQGLSKDMDQGPLLGGLALLAISALMGYRLYRLFANWKTPFFTLSLAGVQFRGSETVTPWAQVDNYQVNVTTYYGIIPVAVRVDFDLSPGKPFVWPVKNPPSVKYKPKKNEVRAGGIGLSPSPKKVAPLIGQYRGQSYALDRLAELGDA